MSITINGTGSITGLTAGGLPDGSITADDIASGAVTAAKLAAGAGGKILQVVSDTNGTATEAMGASFTKVTGLEVTLTPASTSSRFVILITAYTDGSSTTYGPFQIRRNTSTDVGTEHYWARPASASSQTSYFAVDAPATTSNVTYNLYGKSDSSTVYVGRCTMIVYEVSS